MSKIKKELKIMLIMAIISAIIIIILGTEREKFQYLNSIDYNVKLREDGSMLVTETWDIYVKNTNTLFKNFYLSNKFGNVRDVSVKDLDTGKIFFDVNQEMYHVTTGGFYALELENRKFEIAWGIGMDFESGNKKYQISYVVNDVVTSYNDCQEIYWQFLGRGQNAIPAKKVTGTITLPQKVQIMRNLRVWGHGPTNGIIEKVEKDKIEFKIKELRPRTMLEVRVVTEDKMFNTVKEKTREFDYLDILLSEETGWSEETNNDYEVFKIFKNIVIIIYLVLCGINIISIIKYKKINQKEDDGLIRFDVKYFREIPRDGESTPGEGAYLYNYEKERLSDEKVQEQSVTATILNLCLKKKIKLNYANDNKVYVKIINKDIEDLNNDEKSIFKLLYEAGKSQEYFEIEELKTYAKENYYKYSKYISGFANCIRESLYSQKLIDKNEENRYCNFKNANIAVNTSKYLYMFACVLGLMFNISFFEAIFVNTYGTFASSYLKLLLILAPLIILYINKNKLKHKCKNKISVITQIGFDEKQQWEGLKNYLEDYSLLNEKEIKDLLIWEKYLVYATAFGISEKVLKQMKADFPGVFIEEKWNDEKIIEKYPVMYFLRNTNWSVNEYSNTFSSPLNIISDTTTKSYDISITEIARHSSSSSSGGGGGFSGGGGGRRRRRPEWAVDNLLLKKIRIYGIT